MTTPVRPCGRPALATDIGIGPAALSPADERQSARPGQRDDTIDPDRSLILMRRPARFLLAAAVAAHAFAGVAAAQSSPQTANLSVTASVAANCTVSTSPVNFGSYNPLSAATV
ncbi:MAG TPA: hypothetical protein VFX05_06425, partial [Casimicrobiaceae bacterium]|nr:hypothetical protein [Casimicrobiaceae bacterium]